MVNRTPKEITLEGETYRVDSSGNYYIYDKDEKKFIDYDTPSRDVIDRLQYGEFYSYDVSKTKKIYPDPVIKFKRAVPPRSLPTSVDIPERAERLEMPLIGESVKEEVERLTLEMITDPEELLNADLNFRSIRSVPESEILRTDDEQALGIYFEDEYDENDTTVVPEEVLSDLQRTSKLIDRWANFDTESTSYPYKDYAKTFTVVYDAVTGIPVITANIPLSDGIIDQIQAVLISRRGGDQVRDTNVR